jgi:hypothetical protein
MLIEPGAREETVSISKPYFEVGNNCICRPAPPKKTKRIEGFMFDLRVRIGLKYERAIPQLSIFNVTGENVYGLPKPRARRFAIAYRDSSRAGRAAIPKAVPVWSKIFRSMTVTSSPGLSGGGAITTARYVGFWYGARSLAVAQASRAHRSNQLRPLLREPRQRQQRGENQDRCPD